MQFYFDHFLTVTGFNFTCGCFLDQTVKNMPEYPWHSQKTTAILSDLIDTFDACVPENCGLNFNNFRSNYFPKFSTSGPDDSPAHFQLSIHLSFNAS